MSKPTCISLFAGGGVKTLGAIAAGFTPVLAVEYNPDPKIGPPDIIAQSYAANIGPHVLAQPVESVNYRPYEGVDLVIASPVCKEFSVANNGKAEGDAETESAEGVCRAIRDIRPRAVMIENVWGYRKSKSFAAICDTLNSLGYFYNIQHLNAASFGVPQTRQRLILRAVRDGMVPSLPAPSPWRGWYEAIEDLIPGLPESKFADWQLKRLPPEFGTCLVSNAATEYSHGLRSEEAPALSVTAQHNGRLRAYIVDQTTGEGKREGERVLTVPNGQDPLFTLTANPNRLNIRAVFVEGTSAGDRHPTLREASEPAITINAGGGGRCHRGLLDGGKVVAMTPRALARFQSIPDSYVLPEKRSLACTIIGNGFPTLMSQRLCEGLREAL